MLPASQPRRFSCTIEGFDNDLQVLSFEGEEALSRPYRFVVELVSECANIDLEALLNRQAFLQLDEAGNGIHGQVYQAAQADSGQRLHHYRIVLVPHLSYLAHRRNPRIFQHKSVPQIIEALLADHGVTADAFRFALSTASPAREYCVQYGESDLHFLQRLCEEEGIHYHFEHSRQGHQLVFGDDQTVFPRLDAPVAYVQHSAMVADEALIDSLEVRLEARPNHVARRDYDFQHPRLLLEAGASLQQAIPAEPMLEDYDYPGRFTDRARGRQLSQRALERHRVDYRLVQGGSDVSRLASGHFLTLARHPRPEWNDLWLLTEVRHEGSQHQVLEEAGAAGASQPGYRNTFFAAPWDACYRPPLRHRKPRVLGCQTAVVTGPAGEEIHCDALGRVKVQFFWDREGQGDDSSSCWLRVSSSWAGERIGGVAIPRVGMEVLVEFLEGDPDQPVVTGCLYHGEHPTPYPLPAQQACTVLKTRSSPGGGGFNELRVDDTAGQEQVFLQAQRNWDQYIGRDQKIHVGKQRHDSVTANSYSQFQAEEHRTTLGDRKTELKAGDHLQVGDSQHLKVGNARLLEAGQQIHIKAGQHLVIEAGQELTVDAGGSFIRLDGQGVLLAGPQVRCNSGGTPGLGSGVAVLSPLLPLPVPLARPGRAGPSPGSPPPQTAQPEPQPYSLAIRLADVPGDNGFPLADTSWQILLDGHDTPLLEGVSDEAGQVQLDAGHRLRLGAAASGANLWLCYPGQCIPLLLHDEPASPDQQHLALCALDFHDRLRHSRADAACQARVDQDPCAAGELYRTLQDGEV